MFAFMLMFVLAGVLSRSSMTTAATPPRTRRVQIIVSATTLAVFDF
jgi:hypothetical protein